MVECDKCINYTYCYYADDVEECEMFESYDDEDDASQRICVERRRFINEWNDYADDWS